MVDVPATTTMDPRRHPAPPERHAACLDADAVAGPRGRAGLVAMLAASLLAVTAAAGEFDPRIDESLALCAAADQLPADERVPVLARGLALADAALADDDRSARAHFAVVCNLGKATGLATVGFSTIRAVYRLQREIDATLALTPDDPEALAAKGALLVKLPRWLGGDRHEAEQWLRRALAIDPQNATARAYLDEIVPERGVINATTR
jgi:hypothetical protein